MNKYTAAMLSRIKPEIMIDLLVTEGVTWAGWYSRKNLIRKYDEVFTIGSGHGFPFSRIETRSYRRGMGDQTV